MTATGANETLPEQPRKLTPSERSHELMRGMLDAITAALTKRSPTLQRDSISTSRNAKADMQFETVIYRADDEPDDSFVARSDALTDHLNEKYEPSRKQHFDRDYLPDEKGKK